MKPLNALIAEALGWRTWSKPSDENKWYQERDGEPGCIEGGPLYDYIPHLRHLHHRHHRRVMLKVGDVGIILNPNEKAHIMLNVTVGHKINFSYHFVDTDGNPMKTQPTPDAAAQWQNAPSTPPIDTLTPAADGTTAQLAATAAGADTVGFSVVVGGVTFSASAQVAISDASQVLGGVVIDAEVV